LRARPNKGVDPNFGTKSIRLHLPINFYQLMLSCAYYAHACRV